MARPRKITIELIRERMKEEKYILLTEEYINSKQKLEVMCDKGHLYSTSWNNFNNGRRCPHCKGNDATRKSLKDLIKLFEKEGFKYIEGEYKNNKSKLTLECCKGHIFDISWDMWNSGIRCPYCCKRKKLTSELKEDLELEGYELISKHEKDIKGQDVLTIKCDKGHSYEIKYANHSRGTRCPHCEKENRTALMKSLGLKNRKTYEFVKEEMEKEGLTVLSKEYLGKDEKMSVVCPNGHNYETTWQIFQMGSRCPHCKMSKGEKEIKKYLESNSIEYIFQHKFEECKDKQLLKFDFYIPKYNMCIEYDGEQHYMPIDFAGKGEEWAIQNMKNTQLRDRLKDQYCKDNNINMIRIPYWEFENIKEILATLF